MNILVAIDKQVSAAVIYWLHSQGHHTHTCSATRCQKLVLDYAHLEAYLWNKQAPPDHWPAPEHWLLLDAYLQPTQLISIIHMGCRHISLAPIQPVHLQQWLAGQPQIMNPACAWSTDYQPKAALEPMLLPFINCIMSPLWSEKKQLATVEDMSWRNIALQSGQYQQLDQTLRLDPIKFSQLAFHTLAGALWLAHNGYTKAALIASQHHEHWDASGYPMAIAGTQICLEARLAKLYDSYVGLRKHKAYARACDHPSSINKLTYGDGYLSPSQFDPELLKRFLAAQKDIEKLYTLAHPVT